MFNLLSQKIASLYERITTKRLSASQIDTLLVDIEDGLLQADVPFEVVQDFLSNIRADVIGEAYPKHLNAQQAFVKILNHRLIELLKHDEQGLTLKHHPTKILVAGLQGSGKTTTIAKLALHCAKQKKSVLVVSLDVYRPAAREQLAILAKKVGVEYCGDLTQQDVLVILDEALKRSKFYDILIIDTAGRTQIDAEMMIELKTVAQHAQPHETLYVLDSMAGQESLNVAKKFNETVTISGVIVTKLDSDTRAGAILGLKTLLNLPIKFISMGEQVDIPANFTVFYPERIAQRILGMGDILSLIDQIEQSIDKAKAQKMQESMMQKDAFNFEDMRLQLEQVTQMLSGAGGLKGMMQQIPGMGSLAGHVSENDANKAMKKSIALIDSMTPKERNYPYLLQEGARKARISRGSGLTIADLNHLIKQLKQTSEMLKLVKNKGKMANMMNMLKGKMPFGF
jgi:signal recognition particle subunit SRP54